MSLYRTRIFVSCQPSAVETVFHVADSCPCPCTSQFSARTLPPSCLRFLPPVPTPGFPFPCFVLRSFLLPLCLCTSVPFLNLCSLRRHCISPPPGVKHLAAGDKELVLFTLMCHKLTSGREILPPSLIGAKGSTINFSALKFTSSFRHFEACFLYAGTTRLL